MDDQREKTKEDAVPENKTAEPASPEGSNENSDKPDSNGEKPSAKSKLKRKKLGITVGIVAAIVVVAGVGFWTWHEQPSFCSAICHTPMDPYLPTYEAQPGEASLDKWGNEVADASGMLGAVHRVEADSTCMSCHVPTIGEQVSEGMAWIGGNYEWPLDEKNLEQLTHARGLEGKQFCLNEGCHNITVEQLAEKTAEHELNPHDFSYHGEVACSDCHKSHRASVMMCSTCHDNAPVPEGWITADEAESLNSQAG